VCLIPRNAFGIQKHFYSPQIDAFWENLREKFDLILIDSPSFESSPDGIAISRRVDGVVLVLEAERTRWPVAERLKERILLNGGNILGIAFNKRRYYIPDFVYRWL
jgi:Mrp family chromosome partitioning ATPase